MEINNIGSLKKSQNWTEGTSPELGCAILEITDKENGEVISLPSKQTVETKRDQWKRRFDFFLACVGLSVGLGNVWRFPYLCYKNGGGAFLIPYFISVFAAGIPVFVLEVTLGQMMSQGGIAAWNICPLFQGIGYASMVTNFSLDCYYNVILAWALYYLFSSFTPVLPWTLCGQWWNTPNCRSSLQPNGTANSSQWISNNSATVQLIDPATEFWENHVLGLSSGIEHLGSIQWKLALCLLLAWIIVFFCIFKGIKTSGKVMYFTATSPYLFMFILLIRAVTLDGSVTGLLYYVTPDWSKLGSLSIWSDAGSQIFFSYSISLGTLTAMGSYNPFRHNSLRDCLMYATVNTFTSLLAGLIVFATLGHMAHVSGTTIDSVADSGPGLAFVVYPKALGIMPGSPFWSVCFFLMILLLGIDSQFAGVEGFVTSVTDFYPRLVLNPVWRSAFVGSICIACYMIGLTMVTEGGMYIFQLLNHYAGSVIILLTAFFECITVGYFYGAKKMAKHMKVMNGWNLRWLPHIFWCFITPLYTLSIFIVSVIIYEELTYDRTEKTMTYTYPSWAVKVGWLIASCSVFMIPLVMVIQFCRTPGSPIQRLRKLCTAKLTEKQKECLMSNEVPEQRFVFDNSVKDGVQNIWMNVNEL